MRKLLTFAIPSVLAVGLVAAALNEPETDLAAQKGEVTEESPPAVIEVPATAPTTTTTTAAPAPAPAAPEPETTTTTAPPVTTTTVRVTTTTKPKATKAATQPRPAAPAPAPAPKPAVDCGTGTAVATAQGYDTGSDYRIRVLVDNQTTKHIEIDSIVVRATFDSGEKVFTLPVAGQTVVAPTTPGGHSVVTIEIPESASPTPPRTLVRPEFRFHTAGLPECAAQP